MFEQLSITACDDITVHDLLRLWSSGHSVYRTSHAGNWSLYKLLLSRLGLPDCIWDVTCMYRDVNNQPRHQLLGGQRIPLLDHELERPDPAIRFLTAYQRHRFDPNETVAHFHVRPLKALFGATITSQSELLLQEEERLRIVFDIIQRYAPEYIGRYILPCGCMVTLQKRSHDDYLARCSHNAMVISRDCLAESAIATLKELKRMVFDSHGYEPSGGALYSFELVVASFYLWSHWTFGDKTIYELSGPDMINYATKAKFVGGVAKILKLIGDHAPADLVPRRVEAKIVPTTVFRFGYPHNLPVARRVVAAHQAVMVLQQVKRDSREPAMNQSIDCAIQEAVKVLKEDGAAWNLFHRPDKDAFYSQHDMLATGAHMVIPKSFLHIPLGVLGETLRRLPRIEGMTVEQTLSDADA